MSTFTKHIIGAGAVQERCRSAPVYTVRQDIQPIEARDLRKTPKATRFPEFFFVSQILRGQRGALPCGEFFARFSGLRGHEVLRSVPGKGAFCSETLIPRRAPG
jgi:hypothetical protein